MKSKGKAEWIGQGYKIVAQNGFNSLSIEVLSRIVGKNKSSFYHYFGNLEMFRKALLEHHITSTQQFANAAAKCANLKPEVLNLMIELKDDLFFHKQLRINRTEAAYKACFERSYDLFQKAIFDKWANYLGLSQQTFLAATILNLASENFLLRITYDSFSYEWLESYLSEFSNMMKNINNSSS